MVTLYGVDASPLMTPEALADIEWWLDDSRRRRVQRLQVPEKQAQCAAAGLLLTYLCGKNGTPPTLFHGSRGKPYLYGREDLFFSLSHTGQWVFCALSDKEIGLDAQALSPHNPAIVARHFSSSEQAWLEEQGDKDITFTCLWCMKEAYLKLTGFGMVLPMSSFTVPIPPADGWDEQNRCGWGLTTYEDVQIALCGETVDTAPAIKILSIEELKSLPD
ncbi:MAG: 4'-phosphopantetheinyl transferase superfamily protein [Clostridia bacterium]|nr:4'-phosphopantetheinyl transferase superfamily protein [Clostridia bacterium]